MAAAFLDTNILLRHLLGDHPEQSPRATRLLMHVEQGEIRLHMSLLAVSEAVFTLERSYRQPKKAVADALLPLLEMPGIILPGKRVLRRAFELYTSLNLPFADAYHAALMEQMHPSEIISFDRDFDRIPGIRRTEP